MAHQRKGGLGKGLAALIPSGPELGPKLGDSAADVLIPPLAKDGNAAFLASYSEINVELIDPNPQQPRNVFDEEALEELTHSIREFGVLQPVVVRKSPESRYQLIMGERRLRATKLAGKTTIPAIIKLTSDDDLLRDALLENVHRAQLNALEEASAYQQLLEDFGATHEELAQKLGRSRSVITNTVRLLRLPIGIQRRVASGVLSAGHARALLSLEGKSDEQESLATRIVAEGLSVRAAEEAVVLASRTEGEAPRKRAKKNPSAPLVDVAERLSLHLDTTVVVTQGTKKGKIVIEYGSFEDLERLAHIITGAHDSTQTL